MVSDPKRLQCVSISVDESFFLIIQPMRGICTAFDSGKTCGKNKTRMLSARAPHRGRQAAGTGVLSGERSFRHLHGCENWTQVFMVHMTTFGTAFRIARIPLNSGAELLSGIAAVALSWGSVPTAQGHSYVRREPIA